MSAMDQFRAAVKRLPGDRSRWTKVELHPWDLRAILHDQPTHGRSTEDILGFPFETDRMIPTGELHCYNQDTQDWTFLTMRAPR